MAGSIGEAVTSKRAKTRAKHPASHHIEHDLSQGSGQATDAFGRHSAHKARQIEEKSGDYLSLPVSNEDLERGDEVSEGDALVSLPLLVGLKIIDEDDEVVAALVVDLGLLSLAASHCRCV